MHGNLCATRRCQQILWYVRMTKHKDWVFILLIIAVLCITSLILWEWAEWVRFIEKVSASKYNPCTKLSSDITPDLFHSIHCSIRYYFTISGKKTQSTETSIITSLQRWKRKKWAENETLWRKQDQILAKLKVLHHYLTLVYTSNSNYL